MARNKCSLCGEKLTQRIIIRRDKKKTILWFWCPHCDIGQREKSNKGDTHGE